MKYLHLVAFVVVLANPLPSNALNKSTEQAIKEVALDYAEGWYAGDPERMARALHSKLAKRALLPTTDNKFRLDDIGKETLVERTRNGGGKNIPKERRRTEVIIYDVVGKAAVVKLTMHDWVDFLQLIKEDGQWKIINVLWELNSEPSNALNKSTEQAIKEVALDYAEGWYAGNPERMARALHDTLAKRALLPTKDNKYRLDDMGKKRLVEYTKNGGGKSVPKKRRRTEVIIYDVVGKAAVVKLTMHDWVDFLQLIKKDGQWKIINVLWELNSE